MSLVVVQTPTPASTFGGTSVAVTWTNSTVVGNTLIAVVLGNNASNISAPSGWTLRRSDTGTAAAHWAVFDIVDSASRSGAETFTFASQNARLALIELSGIDNAAPFDKSVSNNGSNSAPTVGPLTQDATGAYLIAFATDVGPSTGVGNPVDTTTWTALIASTNIGSICTAKPAGGAGTFSCDFASSSSNWVGGIVSYNAAGQTGSPLSANAGTDQQAVAGATIALNGSGSGGTPPYTYAWTQTGGTTVTLSSPSAQSPTFTAPADVNPATLTFSLTVTDSASGTSTATTTVTVAAGPFMYRREAGAWVKRKLYRRVSGAWQWP